MHSHPEPAERRRTSVDFDAPVDPSQSHIPALDGVRGLAILLVLVVHCYFRGPVVSSDQSAHPFLAGWIGVDLFFVLSGFLITAILLRTRGRPAYLRDFYLKRVFRIFPLYYLMLFGLMALGLMANKAPPLLAGVLTDINKNMGWYLAYVSNWAPALGVDLGRAPVALSPLWSLAVEEQFYLVWPLLVLAVPPRPLAPLLVAMLGAVVATRTLLAGHWSSEAIYRSTLTHCDGLIVGALLAVLARRLGSGRPFLAASVAALASGLAGYLSAVFVGHGTTHDSLAMQRFGFVSVAFMWGGLIGCAMLVRPLRSAMSWGPLRRLGRYSYFIYLIHWPALLLLSQLKPPPGYLSYAGFLIAFTALMMGLGWLSFTFFERPMLRLREKIQRLLEPGGAPESGPVTARSPANS